MQSNAQEVINNGWHTTISLYIFPNSYSKSRPRKIKTKPPRFYAHLGKSNSESGSGKKNDVATKHGREVRHGVFQIGKGNVKNSCLALSLLVGISYLHMDAKMYKLERNRNITLTELYDNDDITKVYVDSGLRVGAVQVDQLHLVYAGYLKPLGIDLVVFSKAKSDTVVYDLRLGDNNEIVRITDKIIYLWLNDSHYDLILDIVEDLMNFIMLQPKGSVWVAHNGGRFDNIFLMHELVKRQIVPRVIMNGSKIMCIDLEERNLKIIDSYLFISMRLSMFPKALGIKNLAKGFHPYLFTDLNYVGAMIGLEYFEPPSEGSKERKSFDKWYEEQKSKTYIFREAIYYYCCLDVDILRQGCIIFSRLIYKVTGVLPFYDRTCHTVAGLALKIYRGNYLEKHTIGQIPTNGYGDVKVNQSAIALCWLREIEKELCEKGFILDSRLSVKGEQKILARYVDGYCEQTRTIYQFHGCFYHGCKNATMGKHIMLC